MTYFDTAIRSVLGIEGDYSNRANDRGGKTRFGITEAVARANGYMGSMESLPLETAETIYKRQYWDTLRLDDVAAVWPNVAFELFDTGVNCGIGTSGMFLQRALNAFNRQGHDYPDVVADGVMGPMTISALKAFAYRRGSEGEVVMLRALNALQGARYIGIAEADHEQEENAFGWFRARVSIA